MARRPMFSREITTTFAVCSIFDMSAKTMSEAEYPTEETEREKMLTDVRENYETETVKILSVNDVKTVRKMYGMYIEDFIRAAMELDPETRKPLEK